MKLFRFKFDVFLLSLLIIISTFSSNNSFAKCSIQIENFRIMLKKQEKDLDQKLKNIKKLPSNKKDIQIKNFKIMLEKQEKDLDQILKNDLDQILKNIKKLHSLLNKKYRSTEIFKKNFTSCSEDEKIQITLLVIRESIIIRRMQRKIQSIEIAKLQKRGKEISNELKKITEELEKELEK